MLDFINYVLKGSLHYLNLLFNMLDFKELGFMWIVILGIFVLTVVNKDVRKSIFKMIKPTINVIRTLPGFIFLLLFLSYYIYIAIFFEKKITIVFLVLSLYLFLNSFFKTNLDLLADSKNTIWGTMKGFSIPILLLFIQQLASMLEINDFTNIKMILFSLLIIPIFLILFFILKHYCVFDDFYKRHKKYMIIDDFHLFKIFNDSLIECGSYKLNDLLLSKVIIDNPYLDFEETKFKVKLIIPKMVLATKKQERSKEKEKLHKSKIFNFFNYIWLFNILGLIICIMLRRFSNINYDFWYYWTYAILIIYFWYDLMKIRKIENQYDFIIYLFIYVILIIILIVYANSLVQIRLTELGFMLPVFVCIRYITFDKTFPSLLKLPFLSVNNFFGLRPTDYDNKGKIKERNLK